MARLWTTTLGCDPWGVTGPVVFGSVEALPGMRKILVSSAAAQALHHPADQTLLATGALCSWQLCPMLSGDLGLASPSCNGEPQGPPGRPGTKAFCPGQPILGRRDSACGFYQSKQVSCSFHNLSIFNLSHNKLERI